MTAIDNRKYTGLLRTPSSMAWLIKKRATTAGGIERKNRRINALRSERDELCALLRHIDSVIRQHETRVDPQVIEPYPSNRPALGGYGDMGRFILRRLRHANGEPTSTTNIAIDYLVHLKKDVTMLLLKDARERIGNCARDLASKGILEARHIMGEKGRVVEGRWILKQSTSE